MSQFIASDSKMTVLLILFPVGAATLTPTVHIVDVVDPVIFNFVFVNVEEL